MADDSLKSVHLEWPRREAFRQARQGLQHACGESTRMGIRPDEAALGTDATSGPLQDRLPPDLDCGLVERERVYPLKVGINTIGRLQNNDVVIEDPHISRRHCAIVIHTCDGFELHDVASKNGTFLNGARLEGPTPLASGDEIRMCGRYFVFVSRFNGGQRPKATVA